MDDKDAIAGVQLEHFSNKNPLVHADDLLDEDSKPSASKSLTNPVPNTSEPSPTPTRGPRVDSVGMAVALNSQRFKPKLMTKGGGGNGGGGRHKRASPGAAHSRAAAFKKTSSLLSSFGFSKSGSTGPSRGEGGGKSSASRNASFQRASKVRNKR